MRGLGACGGCPIWMVVLVACCGTATTAQDAGTSARTGTSTSTSTSAATDPSIEGVTALRDFELSQGATEMGVVPREVDTLVVRADGTLQLRNRTGDVLRTARVPTSELDRIARMAAAPWFTRIRSSELHGEGVVTYLALRSPTRNHSVSFAGAASPEAQAVLRELFRLRVMVQTLAPEAASSPACASDADCTTRECGCSACQPREHTEPALTNACRPGRCVASPCGGYRPICEPTSHRCALVRSP